MLAHTARHITFARTQVDKLNYALVFQPKAIS